MNIKYKDMDKTITEDFVSFEVAKLLKEKGFREWCSRCYGVAVLHNGSYLGFDEECELKDEGRENEIEYVKGGMLYDMNCKNDDDDGEVWAAPTLYVTMKWLREKGIIITITYTRCSMQTIGSQMMFGFNIQNVQGDLLSENTEVAYDSYEQSEMDAIKYTLENLI